MSYRNMVSMRFYIGFWGALIIMNSTSGWKAKCLLCVALVNLILTFVSSRGAR